MDQTRLYPANLAQIRFAVLEIFHTQTKSYRQRQKQNLAQFSASSDNTHTGGQQVTAIMVSVMFVVYWFWVCIYRLFTLCE